MAIETWLYGDMRPRGSANREIIKGTRTAPPPNPVRPETIPAKRPVAMALIQKLLLKTSGSSELFFFLKKINLIAKSSAMDAKNILIVRPSRRSPTFPPETIPIAIEKEMAMARSRRMVTLLLLKFHVFTILFMQIIKREQPITVWAGSPSNKVCRAGTTRIPPPTPNTGAKIPIISPVIISRK